VGAWPFAGVPFSDDFSYTKTALDFAQSGQFHYNGWAAPMLGWQVLWGALFIKLFGFSFNVVRLSLLPFAMANAYLFHRILRGFGLTRQISAFGTLTLCLSPLCLLLSTSFMTDVTGLLVLILCLYMCQRAILSVSDRETIAWLVSAALVNLAAGTVRQTSWLGALVIVPSTAWFLRRRPKAVAVGVLSFFVSLGVVEFCMHWANKQPYFQPESILIHPFATEQIEHAFLQLVRTFLCLSLVLLPVLAAWLPAARRLGQRAALAIVCLLILIVPLLVALHHAGALAAWLMPWLQPILGNQGMEDPDPVEGAIPSLSHPARLVLSIVVLIIVTVVAAVMVEIAREPKSQDDDKLRTLRSAWWLVGPFSLVYLLLLVPRAGTFMVQDRYLLGVMPAGILLLLLGYQRWIADKVPSLAIAVLTVFCVHALGSAHDVYSQIRASEAAVQELRDAGVPRTRISEGFPSDAWQQLQAVGHMNSPSMVTAEETFDISAQPWTLPRGCTTYVPEQTEPVIQPLYFVTQSETPCLLPSGFPPVKYRAWLPPFHRQDYVRRLPPPGYVP
jgi:hypothetical protein